MMSNEEIERKMAFIVEQQALFASDIQRLQESQARTDQVSSPNGSDRRAPRQRDACGIH